MNERRDYKNDVPQGQGGDEGRVERRSGRPRFFKKKVCRFCANRSDVDYKNIDILGRYVTERGKILPARITGVCARHQRAVSVGIKRARHLAFLPFVAD